MNIHYFAIHLGVGKASGFVPDTASASQRIFSTEIITVTANSLEHSAKRKVNIKGVLKYLPFFEQSCLLILPISLLPLISLFD